MKVLFARWLYLSQCLLFWVCGALSSSLQAQSHVLIEEVEHKGFEAYRLSNGKSEAIVCPAIGRLCVFRPSGSSENLLWENAPKRRGTNWMNWGGEKTFIGPHDKWKAFSKSVWPPPHKWDDLPHEVRVVSPGRLSTIGPVWANFGIKIERIFSFSVGGDLVVEQILHKVEGDPVEVCVWNVAQFRTPRRVSFSVKPDSKYNQGFLSIGNRLPSIAVHSADGFLFLEPKPGKAFKLGVDTAVPYICADFAQWKVHGCSRFQNGMYPDGEADKAGFPVEFYNHSATGTSIM